MHNFTVHMYNFSIHLQFYNFQASPKHRANACSCLNKNIFWGPSLDFPFCDIHNQFDEVYVRNCL
jgi:hypothetical protein